MGNLLLPDSLGDVMKESASIALDYMKANSQKYGLENIAFDKQDIHIHVPEGSSQKRWAKCWCHINNSNLISLSAIVQFEMTLL